MTAGKVVSKLLKFKGFRAVDAWFEQPGRRRPRGRREAAQDGVSMSAMWPPRPDRTDHEAPALAGRARLRPHGLVAALSPRDPLPHPWPPGRRSPVGRTDGSNLVPLRGSAAAVLSGHAPEDRVPPVGLGPLHRLRPSAPDRPTGSTPTQDSRPPDPWRRRDLVRPGPPIRHRSL